MGDGNDGAFSSSTDQELLKFGLEGRFGPTGRMDKFAEQASDIRIAFVRESAERTGRGESRFKGQGHFSGVDEELMRVYSPRRTAPSTSFK